MRLLLLLSLLLLAPSIAAAQSSASVSKSHRSSLALKVGVAVSMTGASAAAPMSANAASTSSFALKMAGLQRSQDVEIAKIGRVRIAVARPTGRGPFPSIIILHGSHGFASEYVELARHFADGGILAVAACWFSGGSEPGRRFIRPLECPQGTPSIPLADSDQAYAIIDSLVAAVRALPESRDDQIALFGHSRGGGAVRSYLLRGGRVQAGIMNSAGYPDSSDLSKLSASVLILHGTADRPADGGSAFTNVSKARAFEAQLRANHKPVEAHYYRGGTHNGLFSDRLQRRDEVRRILEFLHGHFR